MKSCPICKRTYADDTFSFCLDDGAQLSVFYDPSSTLPVTDTRNTDPPRTEILPPQWKPMSSTIPAPTPSAYTSKAGQSQPPQKHSGKHWIVITGTLGLVSIGLVIVVGYLAWKMTNKSVREPSLVSATPRTDSNAPLNANTNAYSNAAKDTQSKLPDEVSSQWLNGVWEGKGYQSNTKSTWTIKLTAQEGTYQIEYPSIPCGGRWTLIENNSARARFRERITQGVNRCEINTDVAIEKVDDAHLSCRYSSPRTRVVIATAVLTKKALSTE